MQHLPDGTYDVIVVDVQTLEDGDLRIEVTITLGLHVGEVVALRRRVNVRRGVSDSEDPLNLLGMCGTLRVSGRTLVFRPERV
jgi:hypothetical protein